MRQKAAKENKSVPPPKKKAEKKEKPGLAPKYLKKMSIDEMANGFDAADTAPVKEPKKESKPTRNVSVDHAGSTAAFAMQETFAKIQAKLESAE